MAESRWTYGTWIATVNAIADAVPDDHGSAVMDWEHAAKNVLVLLSTAGLLVDPEGETDVEWASHDGNLVWGSGEDGEYQARREVAEGKGGLMSRTVHRGRWREVRP